MHRERSYGSGFSAMFGAAILSVVVLICAAVATIIKKNSVQGEITARPSIESAFADQESGSIVEIFEDSSATSTEIDPIALVGPATATQLVGSYAQLIEQGTYTKEAGEEIAQTLAPLIKINVAHHTFTAADIKVDNDASYDRMLAYRSDLRDSLEPLLKNSHAELELFALYSDTKDTSYLAQLRTAAENYRVAASSTMLVIVPKDALYYHVSILNAMSEFAATLEALATYATDPFASVALLRAYNAAEQNMFNSFNAYGTYYASKK